MIACVLSECQLEKVCSGRFVHGIIQKPKSESMAAKRGNRAEYLKRWHKTFYFTMGSRSVTSSSFHSDTIASFIHGVTRIKLETYPSHKYPDHKLRHERRGLFSTKIDPPTHPPTSHLSTRSMFFGLGRVTMLFAHFQCI